MNLHVVDDTTYSIEIGIDAEEEELGIVGGRVIRWKRATIYLYELADGRLIAGLYLWNPKNAPDHDVARARARRKAFERVAALRDAEAAISPSSMGSRSLRGT